MEKQFVIVSGFEASGSSAVVDLLKEFEGCYECDAEIRFIMDPYGISQLERALTDDWDWIRASGAISDFLEMCRKGGRHKSHFPLARYGMGYKDTINPEFDSITEDYIDSLCYYKKGGASTYHYKSKMSYPRYVLERIRYAIQFYSKGRIHSASKGEPYFYGSHPSKEEFYEKTKKYFDNLYSGFFKGGVDTVVLDQGLVPNDSDKIGLFVHKCGMKSL